jgi:hypothetical protein
MEQKIWWYSLNKEQKGPVTKEQLDLLDEQNFISPDTPVWREGLVNWINFSDINVPVEVTPQRPPLPPVFSKAVVAQAQAAIVPLPNSNGGSAQGYSQSAATQSDYNTQSNASQPNYNTQSNGSQPNYNTQNNQANFNGPGATSLSDRLNYISDPYYRIEFEKIMKSNETYKGKFNWWAFFFSWVWCFTKGLWQLGLAVLVVATIANFFLPFSVSGVLGLGLAIFSGMRGTYFYYNYKMNNKQLF